MRRTLSVPPRPEQLSAGTLHCQTDAIHVRFEAYRLNGTPELAGDSRSALPSREGPQKFQVSSTPDDSLTTRAWHERLPNIEEATVYMLSSTKHTYRCDGGP